MKIIIFGSHGFIGSNLVKELEETDNSIYTPTSTEVDLSDQNSVQKYINSTNPDAIVNCAGIVNNSESVKYNEIFTMNILHALKESKMTHVKVLISGSAAEYGKITISDLPVNENTPLRPFSAYGQSKMIETSRALEFGKKERMNITIARIFNPIGTGMSEKFLITNLSEQLKQIKHGKLSALEISRLDSVRDYIDIRDVVKAIKLLVLGEPNEQIYNIGSGIETSNSMIIDTMIDNSGLSMRPKIIETSAQPEDLIASQADISRISKEFGWKPKYPLTKTISGIMKNAD